MEWNPHTLLDILQGTGQPPTPSRDCPAQMSMVAGVRNAAPKPITHNRGFEHLPRGCVPYTWQYFR